MTKVWIVFLIDEALEGAREHCSVFYTPLRVFSQPTNRDAFLSKAIEAGWFVHVTEGRLDEPTVPAIEDW